MPTSPASDAMQTAPSQPAPGQAQTVVVLAVALVFRLFVIWTIAAHQPRGWFFTRGTEMGYLAQSLVSGHGLASPFGVPTGPTAFFAPGYPLLAAAVFRLFGAFSQSSAVVLMLLNVLANLVTIWLILHIAGKLFTPRAALFAGLFWSVFPPLPWIPSIFWDTCFSIAFLLGLIALALRCSRQPSRKLWLILGLYSALATLLNPALVLSIAAILVWTAWNTWRTQQTSIVLAGIVFALAFSPWPIRNARVFHAFVPLRTAMPYDLWMGNHPGSNGYLDGNLFPTFNKQELDAYEQQGEIAWMAGKSQVTKAYILTHPALFLTVTAKRIFRFWTGTGNQGASITYPIQTITTTVLGLLGLCFLFRRRPNLGILFALPLLLFPIPYYLAHAEFRFRLVLDPILTILAAAALVTLFTRTAPPTQELP